MAKGGRGRRRVRASVDPRIWREEVERLRSGSRSRAAAEAERRAIESDGVALGELRRCEEAGPDGTVLPRHVKVYVPVGAGAPSERPFAFVLAVDEVGELELAAFGERHPAPGTRSVYERAHKRLHGRYPDQ